jgi:deazaflavin-dependent oxidoreductase (nitroreductase family)
MTMAARTYKPSLGTRLVNVIFRGLARRGRGWDTLHVVSVPGRKSGRTREVPLHVIEHQAHRYLVAIYGEHAWVRNLRANELKAVLTRAGRREEVRATEVSPAEGGSVLRTYVARIPHVGPYLDIPEDPSEDDWARLAETHAVFRIVTA